MSTDTKVAAVITAGATIVAAIITARCADQPKLPIAQATTAQPPIAQATIAQPVPSTLAKERRLQASEATVTASTSLERMDGERTRHLPSNVLDGDQSTSWQARRPNKEYLEIELKSALHLRRIRLTTGLLASHGSFARNDHVKRVTLLVDGHVMQSQDVGNEVQWVDFDDIDRTASRVRLRFDETWVGEEWNDLAISEVQVYVSEQ